MNVIGELPLQDAASILVSFEYWERFLVYEFQLRVLVSVLASFSEPLVV